MEETKGMEGKEASSESIDGGEEQRAAGEFAEKIKKQIRDGNEINQLELVKELGDVLFYVTALANHIGSDLQTVATNNIAKLHDRQKRNKLQGSGDNR